MHESIHAAMEAFAAEVVLADADDGDATDRLRAALASVEQAAAERGELAVAAVASLGVASLEQVAAGDHALLIAQAEQAAEQLRALLSPPTVDPDLSALGEARPALERSLRGRVHELAEILETAALEVEGGRPYDAAALRRALHTIKGEAAVLGVAGLERACHLAEELVSDASGRSVGGGLLALVDWLRQAAATEELRGLAPPRLPGQPAPPAGAAVADAGAGPAAVREDEGLGEFLAQIQQTFAREGADLLEAIEGALLTLEGRPADEEAGAALRRALHSFKGNAAAVRVDPLADAAHALEDALSGAEALGANAERALAVVDAMRRGLSSLAEGGALDASPLQRAVAAFSGEAGGPAAGSLPEGPAPRDEEAALDDAARGASTAGATWVRVDAARLDRLIDLIGELAIGLSVLERTVVERHGSGDALSRETTQVERQSRELQRLGATLRLIPLKSTFLRMARLARDAARRVGKPVEFVASGEATELDRAVVEQIADPLVHLIRNAIDHGLEPAARRTAQGKPPTGRVQLRAMHRGGHVLIELEDDGAGLDAAAIRAAAQRSGLLPPGASLPDDEVVDLIFAPGFSTSAAVTELSGRGVGLDVVRERVEALRGAVEVHSALGQGTLFRMRLPLTLASLEAVVVRVASEQYVVPATAVLATETARSVCAVDGEVLLSFEGTFVPVIDLGQVLQVPGRGATAAQVVLVLGEGEQRVAVKVDEVLGKRQLVVKSLGPTLQGVGGLAGGAVLPDGRVGLVLDVSALATAANGVGGGRRGTRGA